MRSERFVRTIPLLVGLLVLLLSGSFFFVQNAGAIPVDQRGFAAIDFVWVAAITAIAVTGTLILTRNPRHLVGWSLAGFGVGFGIIAGVFTATVILAENNRIWAAATLEAFGTGVISAIFLLIPMALFLFPTGAAPSPRWRPLAWVMIAAAGIGFFGGLVNTGFGGGPSQALFGPGPFKESLGPIADALAGPYVVVFAVSAAAAFISLLVRFRRSEGEERLQLKWVAAAALFFALGLSLESVVSLTAGVDSSAGVTSIWFEVLLAFALTSVPLAMGIAILKYRLYGIDIVISRSLTYGALALFITGVYARVVVGIGTLVGGESNLALSIAAVAIVAVAFEPLRNKLQHWANRLVFGERATPYEVLARTTAQLAGTGGVEDALEQVTQLVVDGTGATDAVLWLKVGGRLQSRAATPSSVLEGLSDVPMPKADLPDLEGDASTPVRHGGEILGALSISMPRGVIVSGLDEKMLNDVAAGTGLLLRNIGLNVELTERAEQLRASRRRLVAAHDAERHRLERDLHDGAQQQVVAVKVKLGLARTLSEREGANDVTAIVATLANDTQDAVDAMRFVAHGIYPPLLETEGLGVALATLGRSFSVPIELATDDLERYPRSLEETIYFCLFEIATSAVDKGATSVTIALVGEPDAVTFTVRHDGSSGNPVSVEDRVEAFGGELSLDDEAGEVVVSGQLPITDVVAVTV